MVEHHGFHKTEINIFNIDNDKKCFLSSKSAYNNDFNMAAENSALPSKNKLNF